MRITGLEVDGYGVWSGLKLEGLTQGLNVLYGPNEAGKTTLLQFVRSVLYGFSPRGRKYLPPIRGGRPGGSIEMAGPSGRFCLHRHRDTNGNAGSQEQLTLTAADGTRQGEHLVGVLLSDVDEATYNNVFAVGLRELQELGTLSDTQAAELLYNLSAGLDRVSLVEVIRELETSRNRILDSGGGPCQVVRLLEQREKLRLEIEQLGKLTGRYGRLAAEQNQLQREIARREEENTRAEYQARVTELAITLRDRWSRRADLDDQLAALDPPRSMPDGAVERLDAINTRLQEHQRRAEQLRCRREELRSEAAGLSINESLWRQAARIEALQEQEPWITTLRDQVGELEKEIAGLQADLAAQRQGLGLGRETEPDSLPTVSTRTLSTLRPPAGAIRQCSQQLSEAKQQLATAKEAAQSLAQQIEVALSAHAGETPVAPGDLADSIDRAGNLVSQFRRRLQIDQRLEEMTRYQRELEEQSRRLVDHQLLPVGVLLGLGAVFVLGVVLVLAGLFMPETIVGSMGWAMALLGLLGSAAAGIGKVALERSNARQLESCHKQMGMLQSQVQQARDDRDALDGQLPRGGGPIQSRLDAAEKELAALEELVPLDTRHSAARQETDAAEGRVNMAADNLAKARCQWRDALAAAGLPTNLVPKQVRQLVRGCDQISQVHRRLQQRREEVERRRGELNSLLGRISQLVADTLPSVGHPDVPPNGQEASDEHPAEQLQRLGETLRQQEAHIARRDVLRRQARLLRRKRAKHEAAISRLKQRRRELLRESDAKDEQELRQRGLQAARAKVLQEQRDAVAREITAAIGRQCSEEAIREQLESAGDQLEAHRDELLERLATLENELEQGFERRGRLTEQLKVLAEDRGMTAKQLELSVVEKRLEQAIARWQVLAVTSRTLDAIRTVYEQERQPETLQEASGYLDRLTQGRYRRVWTPLGEDVLRVDDAEGNSLAVEALSRGTREQLFLALRLALAASYARRGAPLPLILDDVLVNFDADRAKAAAAVLRDFADAGHQLLVFTCHEHILKLFKSLKVPVSRLPDNAEADHVPVVFEQPAQRKRKRRKTADAPTPMVAEEPEQQPSDEIAAIDDEQPDEETTVDEPAEAGIIGPSDEDALWDEEEDADVSEIEACDAEAEDEEEDDYEWEDADDEDDRYDDEDEEDDTAEAA